MLIAQITDVHIGFDQGNPDEYNMERLEAVIQRLVDAPNAPDALVMTGDLTEFGDAPSYKRLAEAVDICPFPVWPMVGNHDDRDAMLAAFPDTPSNESFIQFAIEAEDARVLLLDTLEPGRHGGAFCEARAAWLQSELAAHPNTPTIIAMHHPPFESGISWLDGNANEPWMKRFADSIAGHGQVQAILSGHLHRNIHALWNGVPLTVCASTAPLVALDLRPINPKKPDKRAMITDEYPVYALHHWDGERLISHFEAVDDHRVFARFDKSLQEIVKHIDEERRGLG
ncbi:MAG: phosphodiesterase [Novosphingobium sp.]|nr:phosphodiesterase [Novosphingobium sp.]